MVMTVYLLPPLLSISVSSDPGFGGGDRGALEPDSSRLWVGIYGRCSSFSLFLIFGRRREFCAVEALSNSSWCLR